MKITTVQQFEMLVAEMEKDPAYAKGFRKGIKPLNFEGFWNNIAEKINPFGPPVRDGDGWHKVWKDLKFKVKKKLVNNKTEARATGGGAYKQVPLSPLEEAVANLLEFEKQINPRGNAVGLAEQDEVEALPIEEELIRNLTSESGENVDVATTSAEINVNDDIPTVSTRVRSSNTKSTEKERITLLRKQTEVQQEQCSHLKSISGYLKDVSRYQRKRLEVEEERLKIYKRSKRREEEILDLDVAIKKKKLELMENQLNSNN